MNNQVVLTLYFTASNSLDVNALGKKISDSAEKDITKAGGTGFLSVLKSSLSFVPQE